MTLLIFFLLLNQILSNQLSVSAKPIDAKQGYLTPKLDEVSPAKANQVLQGAIVLSRSIVTSKRLKAVSNNLKTGVNFDEKNLPKENQTIQWYPIPKWLAGEWCRKTERILSKDNMYTSSPEFMSQVTIMQGLQLDKDKNIWNYHSSPSITTINGSNISVKNIMVHYEILSKDNHKFITKTRSIQICINKMTNLIAKVQQNEIVSITQPLNNTQNQTYSKVQWYNEEGFYLSNDERVSVATKIKDFEIQPELENGENAFESFKNYLTKVGLSYLIPR